MDPERHVKLMPARYTISNEFHESGPIADYQKKFEKLNPQEILFSETDNASDHIGKEARQLQTTGAVRE